MKKERSYTLTLSELKTLNEMVKTDSHILAVKNQLKKYKNKIIQKALIKRIIIYLLLKWGQQEQVMKIWMIKDINNIK